MKAPYTPPTLISYGTISSLTGKQLELSAVDCAVLPGNGWGRPSSLPEGNPCHASSLDLLVVGVLLG